MASLPQLPAEETPKLSYRTARKFELREASFSAEEDEAINKWVYAQIETKKKQLEILHTKKVPEWRRIAEGKPREENKSWPFPNCYSADTEVLTNGGWKLISEVKREDLVYSRDGVGLADFYPIRDTYRHPANKMVHFDGKSIDLLVTLDHNMLVEDSLGRNSFVPAIDFINEKLTARWIPLTSMRRTMGPSFHEGAWALGSTIRIHGLPSRAYMRFLGWYISEGNANYGAVTVKEKRKAFGSFCIAQSKQANPEKYEILRRDIETCGFSYAENDKGFTIHARSMPKSLKDELRTIGKVENKRIPRRALGMPPSDLLELLDTLILGDGTNGKGRYYFSTSKGLCDDVQELCQYAGLRACIYPWNPAGDEFEIRGKKFTTKNQVWAVSIGKRPRVQIKKLVRSIIDYSGEVYCIEVAPHHTLLVRRNGKAVWCGNCSNLVHQLVGESCDDLAARVMGLLYATSPLVYFRYFTKPANEDEAHHNSEKSRVLEQFLDYAGYEPAELDLYPTENKWFIDSAKLAKAWVVVRPEEKIEAVYIGYDEAKKAKDFQDETLYEGPKVDNLRYEDVLFDPNCQKFEESDLIARRLTLSKRQLQERVFKGFYRKADVEKILGKPDRYGPTEVKKRENQKKGITSTEERINAEWDVYEAYFYWYHGKKKYRLICWYHWETKTMLNQVFNFIPDNQIPIIETQLSVDGMGMAEMGKDAQEEVSTAKNQRNDAITWGILGVNRISPQNRNIDKNFQLFPGATAPFGKDEFEHFNVADGTIAGLSLQNEQAMIMQARERFGVGPAVAGMGAGQADKKGKFGSMGTLAVMQDSNTRVAHRLSGFRHSHVKLVGLVTDMYGAMGLGRKGSLFGLDDKLLEEALSDYLERKVRIPIRAATGSANKEVTKQNELLLNQAIMMYTKETSSQLQAIDNAGTPPHFKKWLTSIVKAKTRLMQQIVRDFQLSDQPEEYIPNIEFPEDKNAQAQGGPPDPRKLLEMASAIPRPGTGGPAVPGAGLGEAGGGLPGQGGRPAL